MLYTMMVACLMEIMVVLDDIELHLCPIELNLCSLYSCPHKCALLDVQRLQKMKSTKCIVLVMSLNLPFFILSSPKIKCIADLHHKMQFKLMQIAVQTAAVCSVLAKFYSNLDYVLASIGLCVLASVF